MSYDVVIIGAGSGGYACALRAAELGLQVALVEEGRIGGTCLHRGCIPTKAILHAAEVADAARDGAQFGVHSSVERVDLREVRSYAESVVSRLHKGLSGLISARKIDVIAGRGTLVTSSGEGHADSEEGQPDNGKGQAPYEVQVGDRLLTGTDIVLATGSVSQSLPGIEIDGNRVLTSDHALELTELPTSAIVLGGGVIGVEFASAWRSFGVEVTVVEAFPRLVPAEDPAVSTALERAFRKRRIDIRTGAPLQSLEVGADSVTVTVEGGKTVTADVLLVAVGRGPNSTGLGLEQTAVQIDRGWVPTDERLATSVEHVYAVGDLVPGLQLAHRGFAHGIFVAEEIAARRNSGAPGAPLRPPVPVLDEQIPRITYSDPEIASVGLSEEAARERYGEVQTQQYELGGNGRSQILKTQGFVKLIRVPDGPVVGVTMIGARVGELIGEAQLITNWEAHPIEVAQLIHAHPTQGEALGEAHLALAGKPLHAHG